MANEALREAITKGEREGEEVEAPEPVTPDDTDEEGEAETPPPAPPTEAPAMTERDIEKRNEKLEAEDKRHRDRVGTILGEDVLALNPCPLCLDHVAGFVAPAGMVEYSVEEKTAVLVVLGEDAPTPLREAEGVAMCDRCDGYGQLRYPTKVPHVETQACPKCQGSGYVNVPAAPPQNGGNLQFGQAPTSAPVAQLYPLLPDAWNRPAGHPHYGMNPADVGA